MIKGGKPWTMQMMMIHPERAVIEEAHHRLYQRQLIPFDI